jgi:hypothetical protein
MAGATCRSSEGKEGGEAEAVPQRRRWSSREVKRTGHKRNGILVVDMQLLGGQWTEQR